MVAAGPAPREAVSLSPVGAALCSRGAGVSKPVGSRMRCSILAGTRPSAKLLPSPSVLPMGAAHKYLLSLPVVFSVPVVGPVDALVNKLPLDL